MLAPAETTTDPAVTVVQLSEDDRALLLAGFTLTVLCLAALTVMGFGRN